MSLTEPAFALMSGAVPERAPSIYRRNNPADESTTTAAMCSTPSSVAGPLAIRSGLLLGRKTPRESPDDVRGEK